MRDKSVQRTLERMYDFRIPILIVLLTIVFSVISSDFLSLRTVNTLFLLLPANGVVAIGVTMVMIIGELDLSVGGVLALSGLMMVKLLPIGAVQAVLISLAAGAFVGLVNGLVIHKLKVNSLITTIAVGFILSGVSLLFSEGTVFYEQKALTDFGNKSLWIFPYTTLLYFGLTLLVQYLLKRSTFGVRLYAVGGNRLSSSYSGINVTRMGILLFVLSGLFASLGGVLMAARLSTASPLRGSETAIVVITAVLLGGTTLGGGYGDVVKSLLGILLLSLLTKGLTQLEVPAYFQGMIVGVILIFLLYVGSKLAERDRS
jgi:ribose transport system permease protein